MLDTTYKKEKAILFSIDLYVVRKNHSSICDFMGPGDSMSVEKHIKELLKRHVHLHKAHVKADTKLYVTTHNYASQQIVDDKNDDKDTKTHWSS